VRFPCATRPLIGPTTAWRGAGRRRVERRLEIWRYPLPRTGSTPRRGSFKTARITRHGEWRE